MTSRKISMGTIENSCNKCGVAACTQNLEHKRTMQTNTLGGEEYRPIDVMVPISECAGNTGHIQEMHRLLELLGYPKAALQYALNILAAQKRSIDQATT